MLERGDVPLSTAEFFWIDVGSAVVVGLVRRASGRPPLVRSLGMVVAALVPFGWSSG